MAAVQEDLGKEMLLTIVEPSGVDDDQPPNKKRKGAYITPILNKVLLRKTRAKVSQSLRPARQCREASSSRSSQRRGEEETRDDIWDRVRLGCRERTEDEIAYATEGKAPMVNQHWTDEQLRKLQGGDNQIAADGEAIDEDEPLGDGDEE